MKVELFSYRNDPVFVKCRPEISAMIVKKQSRARLLSAHPVLHIVKTQKMYCKFWKQPF